MNFMLAYVSTASLSTDETLIAEILKKSRESNVRDGITGALISRHGHFFQILEGPEKKVQDCFARIQKDPRHRNIILLGEAFSELPHFPYWSMAQIDLESSPKTTQNILDLVVGSRTHPSELHSTPESLLALLRIFSRGAIPIPCCESDKLAHELKTPLTSMLLRTQLLENTLKLALTHTSALQTAMNFQKEILENLNRLGVDRDVAPVRALDLIGELRKIFQPIADQSQKNLSFEFDQYGQLIIHKTLTQQILINLISNALRFCKKEVSVVVVLDDQEIRLSVTDDGPGVPAALLPHIFEPFVKDPQSQGNGLGLAIAKTSTLQQKGTIEARDRSTDSTQSGIEFLVRLPLFRK